LIFFLPAFAWAASRAAWMLEGFFLRSRERMKGQAAEKADSTISAIDRGRVKKMIQGVPWTTVLPINESLDEALLGDGAEEESENEGARVEPELLEDVADDAAEEHDDHVGRVLRMA
jgi:hypothetical protein